MICGYTFNQGMEKKLVISEDKYEISHFYWSLILILKICALNLYIYNRIEVTLKVDDSVDLLYLN